MPDPISNILAIAAMPGLDAMAELIDDELPAQRKGRRDTRALLVLSGAARTLRSQEAAASAFRYTQLWDMAREAARQVDRELPSRPPSADQVDRWLAATDGELGVVAERALNAAAMQQAHTMGLLLPSTEFTLDGLRRQQHLTCDGTVAKPLSEVDEDNRMTRSRAADPHANARIGQTFIGKQRDPNRLRPKDREEERKNVGVPFVIASTHNGARLQRVIFGFETYQDGDEMAAALRLLARVIPRADGGVHFLHYDRLMTDTHIEKLTRTYGVIPIVEMHRADERHKTALEVAEDDPEFQRGRNGHRPAKGLLRATHLGGFHHVCPVEGKQNYRLWMLDGELRVTPFTQRELDRSAKPLQLLAVEREQLATRFRMDTTYRLPCDAGCTVTVDLAQRPSVGLTDHKALRYITAGKVRILNERDQRFWEIAGRRSDSESVVSTVKATLHLRGRATRLHQKALLWDLVGAALLSNAQAWDVHVAQFTPAGAAEYQRQQRALARKVAA